MFIMHFKIKSMLYLHLLLCESYIKYFSIRKLLCHLAKKKSHSHHWWASDVLIHILCFAFMSLRNVNENIIQHLGQNYICLSITITDWLWTPEFGKNWPEHSVRIIWLYEIVSYIIFIICKLCTTHSLSW